LLFVGFRAADDTVELPAPPNEPAYPTEMDAFEAPGKTRWTSGVTSRLNQA
jgi:hypothetical protein